MGAAHSPASDVYSLGVVLWELLTWEAPFASRDNTWQAGAWCKGGRGAFICCAGSRVCFCVVTASWLASRPGGACGKKAQPAAAPAAPNGGSRRRLSPQPLPPAYLHARLGSAQPSNASPCRL